jgi:hypothetical protein
MMLEGQNALARRNFMDAETQNRLLQSEQQRYQLEQAKASQAAIQSLGAQLPPEERQLFLANPNAWIKAQTEPYTLGADQTRFQGTQPIAQGISKPQLVDVPVPGQPGVTQKTWLRPGETGGAAVGGQAMPEILNPAVLAAQIQKAQAGRPAVNVAVNTGQSLWKSVAEKVGESVASTAQAATDATKTIDAANQIRTAIDSGGVIAGPGATLRLQGAQIAQMFGQTGPDAVVNTRATIQGLSKLALGARAALKGQGQVSDFEGKALAKAEAGEIQDLTIPEIRAIADVADKGARLTIRRNSDNVSKVSQNPDTGPLGQFLQVPEPPVYQAPQKSTGGVVRSGTLNGRKVQELSDGSIRYVD